MSADERSKDTIELRIVINYPFLYRLSRVSISFDQNLYLELFAFFFSFKYAYESSVKFIFWCRKTLMYHKVWEKIDGRKIWKNEVEGTNDVRVDTDEVRRDIRVAMHVYFEGKLFAIFYTVYVI